MRFRLLPKERPLMPHQEKAVQYALKAVHPAFCLEMRLGKSLATIRYNRELIDNNRPNLVVAPLTVLSAWQKELTREGEFWVAGYGLSFKKRMELFAWVWSNPHPSKRIWLLMNYESVLSSGEPYVSRSGKRKRRLPLIAQAPWNLVALDESTRIKNPQAQITELCVRGFRNTEHRAILTGLPNPESDLDLFSQIQFCQGGFLGYRDFWSFRNGEFRQIGFDWIPKPESGPRIKEEFHKQAFVLRRAQAGMPDRRSYEVRKVRMSAKQEQLYRQVETEFAYRLVSGKDSLEVETKYAPVRQSWLQQIAGGFSPDGELLNSAKADDLLELLRGELARDKLVVWFKFKHELDYVADRLTKAGISAVTIDGRVKSADRMKRLAAFHEYTRLLLATVRCAKFGIDASVCDTAYYYSNELGLEDREQSEVRIVNVTKSNAQLIIDAVTEGTIDEDYVDLLREKSYHPKLFMTKIAKRIIGRAA